MEVKVTMNSYCCVGPRTHDPTCEKLHFSQEQSIQLKKYCLYGETPGPVEKGFEAEVGWSH